MDNLAYYGFRVAKGRYAPKTQAIKMKVASAYQASPGGTDVPLRVGDPVGLVDDGTVALSAAGSGRIYGVIVGIMPYWDGTRMVFGTQLPGGTAPGTTAIDRFSYVLVQPAQGQVFEVDCDDAVTATTLAAYQALVHENADHSFTAVASEGAYPKLDIDTHATTNTVQWRILGVSDTRNNRDFSGANVKLLVTPSLSAEAPAYTTGV